MSDNFELQMEDRPVKKRQVLSKFGPKCKMGLFAFILLTVGFVIAATYVELRLREIDARYKRELQNLREEFDLRLAAQTCIEDLSEEMGSRCRDGKDGKDGRDGINGTNGKDGRDGLPGPKGDDGSPGSPGTPGAQGATGSPGAKGSQGLQGAAGVAGPPGSPGARGSAGWPGVRGPSGAPGLPGITSESGSVYTRWGRTTCDGDTSLLYHGFAAAAYYNAGGGGVNYQCLHPQPEYNNYNNGGSASIISGAEYQSEDLGLFPNAAYQQNVPCARCYTSRSAVVMIPSRRSCNSGWTKEYEGYLMSSRVDFNQPTTYECVDGQPEYIAGQSANTNGALFYFVKPDCSGTATIGHCPPYDANKQLTCVVCSR